MRKEILFNEGWIFHKGDITVPTPADKGPIYSQSKTERKLQGPASYFYVDTPEAYYAKIVGREMKSDGWSFVDLPHDYVIAEDLDRNGNNALGFLRSDNAWYRKHFTLEEKDKDKRILIRFDGVTGKSIVYLNGCLIGRNFSSYNTFEFDITDYVYFDKENVLAVYVNTEEFEGWWYQGGGIYRNVYLTVTEKVAIDLWGVYAPYQKLNGNEWKVNFETTVINTDYSNRFIKAESFLLDKNGNTVLTACGEAEIVLREKGTLKYSAVIKNPLLWDTEAPNLYTVKTILYSENKIIDEHYTRIGFRTVELDTKTGLLLNGKPIFINGVCAHQDYGLTGLAVPNNVAKHKIKLIKEMGANGYRTSHYQQTEGYLNACDELGLLVMDENRWFDSNDEVIKQLTSLVKRDRNRPSVIFWCTSNEESLHITENGKRIHRALAEEIRKLDKTRFITVAEANSPTVSTVYSDCDILGINYHLWDYDDVHKQYPDKLVVATECCATGTSRDWNFPTNQNGRITDLDIDTNSWFSGREKAYKFFKERNWVVGCYQWDAFEHRGEAMWPRMCSVSGAIDIFLQKKGAFYQNKSHWTAEPMVHIVPHWNFCGLEGQEILVPVYTNCQELELFLNGESLGRKTIEQYGHGEWNVKYKAGTLTAKGYINGKEAAICQKKTTGKAIKLKLTLDNEFEFNGNDLALFTCECVDQNGEIVPDAHEFVKFSVNAPNKIVGTGSDNCDCINVTANERQMYMGKIAIAVKPQKGQTEIKLLAQSDNCDMAQLITKTDKNTDLTE